MSNLPSLFSTDYEFPNADRFFSNEDNYCRDIVLLSTLLRGVRYRGSRVASAKIQKTLEWWSSLASLLTTDSGAMSAPRGVAVTGRIEADAIKALVFTQSNPIPDLLGPSVVIEKPPSLANVEGLLNDSQTAETIDFISHVQSLGSVIDYVMKSVDPMPDLDSKLFKFVICGHANEAWTTIDDGIRIWNKHPIAILEEWYSDEKNSDQLPRKIIRPDPKHVSTFKDFGILPDTEGPCYVLSSKTALKWVKVLSSCLNHLVTHLSSPTSSPFHCTLARSLRRGTILDSHDIHQVNTAMSTLTVMLHYRIFQHLISPHPLVKIFLAGSLTRLYSRTVASEDPVEELAYEVSALRDDFPTSIPKHVTRYLRSMIFPRGVVDSLLQFQKGLPSGFKFDVVVVEARPAAFPNANDYYQHFKDKYIQVHGPKAESYIKKHESPQLFNKETWTDIQVHPEAALMGVACASDSKSKEAQTFMENDNIPIGVVRRCCFCCALLSEILGSTGTRQFKISGSFATISPWVPPYGIPDDILRKVRDALFYILNQKVLAAGDLN